MHTDTYNYTCDKDLMNGVYIIASLEKKLQNLGPLYSIESTTISSSTNLILYKYKRN